MNPRSSWVSKAKRIAHAPSITGQVVSASAAYAKHNVHEALTALRSAGVSDAVTVGTSTVMASIARGGRYCSDQQRTASRANGTGRNCSTPRVLVLVRSLEDEQYDKLSEYMLASEARTLADEILPELRYAGELSTVSQIARLISCADSSQT
jgi:hypothetical protein